MTVSLPKGEINVGTNNWSDVYGNDKALKEAVEALQAASKPVTWYTPKIINTEESRTNTEFGTLTTKDEITGVVVSEGGLLAIGYSALVKQSVSEAGRVAIFIGTNQMKKAGVTVPEVAEVSWAGTAFVTLATAAGGNVGLGVGLGTSFVNTGQLLGSGSQGNGLIYVERLPAGTYAVSIQYKASSGSVSAKERILRACTIG